MGFRILLHTPVLNFALRALDVSGTDSFAFTGALCIDDWAEFGGT